MDNHAGFVIRLMLPDGVGAKVIQQVRDWQSVRIFCGRRDCSDVRRHRLLASLGRPAAPWCVACCVSCVRPFCRQAATVLDACGYIVRDIGCDRDKAHDCLLNFPELAAHVVNLTVFKRLLFLEVDGRAIPVDVRDVYAVIDKANDKSTLEYTLSTKTVKKILGTELSPLAKKVRRELLGHLCWGELFGLFAAAVDERFGFSTFNVHPECSASAHAALKFLMVNRLSIEVRSHRLWSCGAGFSPPAFPRPLCSRSFLGLQRLLSGEVAEDPSADTGSAAGDIVHVEGSDSALSDTEARAAACCRVWAALCFSARSVPCLFASLGRRVFRSWHLRVRV